MLRKMAIALCVSVLSLTAPTMALARGGGGGGGHGGGGFGGGHGGGFAGGFHGGGFHDGGFHGRGFRGDGGGFYGAYDYYDDNDGYYDNGDCYVVQRRIHTTRGWTTRPVQVCG